MHFNRIATWHPCYCAFHRGRCTFPVHFDCIATREEYKKARNHRVALFQCTSTALPLAHPVEHVQAFVVALVQCTSTALLQRRFNRQQRCNPLHLSSALRLHCYELPPVLFCIVWVLHLSSALRLHCYFQFEWDRAHLPCCTCPVHFDCIATPRYCNHFVLNKPQNVFREPRHFALF
jgi:predicted DNA-binding ribbon-helix-helix protein